MLSEIQKVKGRKARRELNAIFDEFEPQVAAAFIAATAQIKKEATLVELTRLLETGQVQAAIDLVAGGKLGAKISGKGLKPGEQSLQSLLRDSFEAGAVMGAKQLPASVALEATLDLTNPESVRFLQENLPELIVEIDNTQRNAARNAVLRGFDEGRPAPKIARELRESIGLTSSQEAAVSNFRRQLETKSVGTGTAPWKRRLSAVEQRAARAEFTATTVNQANVNKLVERYNQSLVNRRSKNIARTEVHRASIEGQSELWRQADEEGLIDLERTRRVWIVTPDERLRDDHAAIPGMNEEGVMINEPFDTPIGPVMAPGTSGDAAFDINCRCAVGLEFID